MGREASMIAIALATAVAGASGCAEPTQLVVVVSTDMMVPAEVDQVRVRVFPSGESVPTYDNSLPLSAAGSSTAMFQTLLSFGAGPRDEDASRRIRVVVDAIRDGTPSFATEVRTGFAHRKRLRLDVYLARRCLTQAAMCLPDQTCGLAGCVSPEVPVERLPPADSPPTIRPFDPRGTPPRQLRPLSTATTATQRPSFRFEPTVGADAHVVTVQSLRVPAGARSTMIPVAAPGDRAIPPLPLDPGAYEWFVEAQRGGVTFARSATWEVFVPGYSSADVSFGAMPDVNRDGLGDVIAASLSHVEVFLGGSGALGGRPDAVLHPPSSGAQRIADMSAIGDFDGDGYGDVGVVLSPNLGLDAELLIYQGGADGLADGRFIRRDVRVPLGTTLTVAAGGDVDGDSLADVLVGAPNSVPPTGYAYVHRYGDDVPFAFSVSGEIGFGFGIAGLGPIDADGFDDFVVSSDTSPNVFVCRGGATPTAPDVRSFGGITGPVAALGDFDQTGVPSLVGRVLEPAGVFVVRAYTPVVGTTMLREVSSWTGSVMTGFGNSVAALGDVDGDGQVDIAIGAPESIGMADSGAVHVERSGHPTAVFTDASATPGSAIGTRVAGVGDVDGDGLGDIAIGAPFESSNAGRVYILHGTTATSFGAPTILSSTEPTARELGRFIAAR